jgi:hypothetical protein
MSVLVQESVRSEVKTDDEGGSATCYGMDGAELEPRQEQKLFFSSEPPRTALGPTQTAIQ